MTTWQSSSLIPRTNCYERSEQLLLAPVGGYLLKMTGDRRLNMEL